MAKLFSLLRKWKLSIELDTLERYIVYQYQEKVSAVEKKCSWVFLRVCIHCSVMGQKQIKTLM